MKRTAVPLLAGALLAATLTTPAHAADPAPTNVRVAWAGSAVRVTWDETGSHPNRIVLHRLGKPLADAVFLVGADEPNQIDLPVDSQRWVVTTEIGVSVGTAAGDTSPMALSPSFDTSKPSTPVLVSSAISGGSTVTVHWESGPPKPDSTPNDPLDRDTPPLYQPSWSVGDLGTDLGPRTAATSLTFTAPAPDFGFSVAESNEWGATKGWLVGVRRSAPTLSVPALHKFGDLFTASGSFAGFDARPVFLQARNTPTSPWYVVASRVFSGGRYSFLLQNSAPREYRVQIPNTAGADAVWFGGYSPVVTSQVQLNVNLGIPYPTVRRGTEGTMTLTVYPLAPLTAVLQRWNGKAWTTVGPVRAAAGTAYGYVFHQVPGKYSYRYYVPNTVYRGATYLAAYSQTAVLTVT